MGGAEKIDVNNYQRKKKKKKIQNIKVQQIFRKELFSLHKNVRMKI